MSKIDTLKDIKNELENEYPKDHSILRDILKELNSAYMKEFTSKLVLKDSYDDKEAYAAKLLIDISQYIFNYTGEEPSLTDTEYDIIREMVEDYYGEFEPTVQIIADKDNVVYHKYKSLRGTLDKIYQLTEEDVLNNKSRKSIDDWVKRCESKIYEKTGKRINLWDTFVYCFPKWDGVSGIFEYDENGELQRTLTRGYTVTNEAQDITHIFKGRVKGPFENYKYPYATKTEIMMTMDNLDRYNETYGTDYKNSRSIVSAIINSDVATEAVDFLQVMPLRMTYIDENGNESMQKLCPGVFDTPYLKCKLGDLELMHDFAFNHGIINGLRCDGMVIYIIDEEIQSILGRENEKQKYEVAFKFTEEVSYSTVVDIEFTSGLFGRMSPVLRVEPVKMKGNTISAISLGSLGRMRQLNLAKGDRVKVLYDIIPYVIFDKADSECKRSGNKPIKVLEVCPDCGGKLEPNESGVILYCNNKKCPSREKGRILNFFNKMNIDGISFATVDTLYQEGYLRNIKDIYKLKDHKKEIMEIPGFGKKSVNQMLESIDGKREVTGSLLLGSLGIESISRRIFTKVLLSLSYDELIELCLNDEESAIKVLITIPGIKDKTAKKIIDGIKDNEKLILYLEQELNVLNDTAQTYRFSVVFTKIRDKELETWTESVGGKVESSLKKDIDILVVPELGVSSTKVDKAKDYGIPVVPIAEYSDYVKTNILGR